MNEYQQMVDDCEARESRLSEWEQSFIASIGDRLGQGKGLTPRQEERLDQIWEKATARG